MNAEMLPSLLNISLLAPLAGSILVLLTGKNLSRIWALIASLVPLVAGIAIQVIYHQHPNPISLADRDFIAYTEMSWIGGGIDVKYMVGIDGISAWLLMLTAVIFPLLVIYQGSAPMRQPKTWYALLLLLETGTLGFFASLDLLLFYVFFEMVLIPAVFMIGLWGGAQREDAAMKFFLYTLAGSLLMLIAILYVGIQAAPVGVSFTTDYHLIREAVALNTGGRFGIEVQLWLLAAFVISFGIKSPLFPLHSWQAPAYAESSTGGAVVMASLLSKMGTFGLVRYCLGLFPAAAVAAAPVISGLAVAGIIYGAYMAVVQTNVRRMIAFSSLSHIGFIILGIFAMTQEALSGAVLQMVAHGITTGALFLLADMLYSRYGSYEIGAYQGIARHLPVLTTFFVIAAMASAGLPGLNGFVGEFMILIGSFNSGVLAGIFAAIAALGVVLAAVYLLNMVRKTFFGAASDDSARADVSSRESLVLVPLTVLMIFMGFYTRPFLQDINAGTARVLNQVAPYIAYEPEIEKSAPAQPQPAVPAESDHGTH
ncbi:MAG: NADH-quinone oxidoreductase subunit M [Bacteroidia bacterium]|nr:NADH-quinone oxidoreductase subunit M [Bacteroidia bacterium]